MLTKDRSGQDPNADARCTVREIKNLESPESLNVEARGDTCGNNGRRQFNVKKNLNPDPARRTRNVRRTSNYYNLAAYLDTDVAVVLPIRRANRAARFYPQTQISACRDNSCGKIRCLINLRSNSVLAVTSRCSLKFVESSSFPSTYSLPRLFPSVYILLRIYLSIPVSNCEGERSFSKLSYIKNKKTTKIRTSMNQSRLSSLALLCIESELIKTIDFSDVIQ
ncbi:hypothetical protein ALC62_12466 [Cyphomyrmex costatus]|uniref:HAT C-terminal dimerisation domain-containing protein n=1 Tax=Cyphomyrmex costatus TaxID=456900 RepID=A0A151IB15_9HYME|nr:hypothetical protein ALC62_12466 [Cyphomyrmex costatus]